MQCQKSKTLKQDDKMSCQACKLLLSTKVHSIQNTAGKKQSSPESWRAATQPGLSLQFCVTWCVGDRKTCQNASATWIFATKISEGASKKST